MNYSQCPKELKQYFKNINGKWFVIILSVYYISEGFDNFRDAANHLIAINTDFEHSDSIKQLQNKIAVTLTSP